VAGAQSCRCRCSRRRNRRCWRPICHGRLSGQPGSLALGGAKARVARAESSGGANSTHRRSSFRVRRAKQTRPERRLASQSAAAQRSHANATLGGQQTRDRCFGQEVARGRQVGLLTISLLCLKMINGLVPRAVVPSPSISARPARPPARPVAVRSLGATCRLLLLLLVSWLAFYLSERGRR